MAPSRELALLDKYSLIRGMPDAPQYGNVAISVLLQRPSSSPSTATSTDIVTRALPDLVGLSPSLLRSIDDPRTKPVWVWIERDVAITEVLVVRQVDGLDAASIDDIQTNLVNDIIDPTRPQTPLWRIAVHESASAPDTFLLSYVWSHSLVDGMGALNLVQAFVPLLDFTSPVLEPLPTTISLSEEQRRADLPLGLEERMDTGANAWAVTGHLVRESWNKRFNPKRYWAGNPEIQPAPVPHTTIQTRAFPLAKLLALARQEKTTVHSAFEELAVRALHQVVGPDKVIQTGCVVNIRAPCVNAPVDTVRELGNYTTSNRTTYPANRQLGPFWETARAYRKDLTGRLPSAITMVGLLKFLPYPQGFNDYWDGTGKGTGTGRSATLEISNLGAAKLDAELVKAAYFGAGPGLHGAAVLINVVTVGDRISMSVSSQQGALEDGLLSRFWVEWQKQWDLVVG
ncbi:hypothetical protein HKX48_004655 [Thoreauomyces humboldtii]|nr:hypothetical protein HKX48_004655 [Thoreauomyces humboldtii]